MPLDPQVQAVLDAAKKANVAELWQLTPHDARAEYLRRTNRLKIDVDIHRFEDREIDGPAGQIPIRIYMPREPKPEEKPVDPEIIEADEEHEMDDTPLELDLGLPRRQLIAGGKKKKPPTPEELEEKRNRLRENLGRFLSSM